MSIEEENRFADEEAREEEEALQDEATSSAEAQPEVVTDTRNEPRDEGPYISEDGAVMGRDFVIPGVNPRDQDPY
ncbi:MAG TPA: hypothetical protein VHH14_07340, partial [Solirubrobacterales bacterium]|nr:hypothetical protein [Solirubrobacterales bacterium]